MRLVNLTPHAIVLRTPDGAEIIVPPSGTVARVSVRPAAEAAVDGLPVPVVPAPEYGPVEGLPAPGTEDAPVYYLVSAIVLARCAGRRDVFAPGTGPADGAIRDENGRIVAVTRLIAAPEAP